MISGSVLIPHMICRWNIAYYCDILFALIKESSYTNEMILEERKMQNSIFALLTTSTINILMLFILLYIILNNTIMSVLKTNSYAIVIVLTIIVIITEASTIVFDHLGPAFRIPNIIANITGFALSPCIPVVLAIVYDEKLCKKLKYFCIPVILNFVLLILSSWSGLIFFVSADNQYMRGPLFSVYVITYLLGLFLLLISNYHQSLQFQHTERIFLAMLYAVILTGTTVQVLFPNIHSTWHCVTLVLVMYYLFQRELDFKYDTVTKLLNRYVFDKNLKTLAETEYGGIIIFDLDKFKEINDTYGHTRGDYCLKTTAGIIETSFKTIGQCYRIGGDEFCVLAPNARKDTINECIAYMLKCLEIARESDSMIPAVSYGYSIYNKNDQRSILQSFQEADEKMYACKKNK